MNGQNDEYLSREEMAIKEQLEGLRSRVIQLHDDIPCLKQCARLGELLQKMYEIRRQIKCHEKTEHDQRGRQPVEEKVWGKVEAVGRGVVLRQGRAATAYAQAAVKKKPIKGELPVMASNAPSAAPP